MTSSTQRFGGIDSKSNDDKLKLVDQILKSSGVNNASYRKAVKGVRWNKIDIPGRNPSELQEMLSEIIKKTGVVRTLGEILISYKQNQMSYELKHDSNKPTRPRLPYQAYYEDNKDRINEKYCKESGMKFNYLLALKFAKDKFDKLPMKKQQPYIDQHKQQVEEYVNEMKEFRESCPEYYKKKKGSHSKKIAAGVDSVTTLTPFNMYRQEQCQNQTYLEALQTWKHLPDDEKVEYIKRVMNSDVEPKKISNIETKLYQDFGGEPKKPLSAFILFTNDFRDSYTGLKKDVMKHCGEAWQKISETKRQFYDKKYEESLVEYRLKLQEYIDSLPKEKQVVMQMKYKKILPKRQLNATTTASFKNRDGSPPSKKIKTEKVNIEKAAVSVIQEKQIKSPKKKAVKPEPIPPLPSRTTAHYYLMTVHDGDMKKAKKAYKKLSPQEKQAYRTEMLKANKKYLDTTKILFAKMTPNQVSEEKKKIKKTQDEHQEQLSWHKPSGTDDEEKNSSESEEDSDSDSS